MKSYLMAVDIGTSACKAALFHEDGTVAASSSQPYPVHYPRKGWAEQDADDWWRAACDGMRDCLLKSGVSPEDIACVGVDGQSWACVPVDARGEVLFRSPLWMDTRSADICREVRRRVPEDAIIAVNGNAFRPTYTTPKILWLKEHHPQVYARTKCFLQSNSFIVYRLTGALSQDVSQGYGLHVFDIRNMRYDDTLCSLLGIDAEKLPPLFGCADVVGGVTAQAAALTGLRPGTLVVAGGLDAACGTLGAGVVYAGQTQEQGGQAGGMSICLSEPVIEPSLILGAHAVPGKWLLQGGTVGGGGCMRWLARELGSPEMDQANGYDLLCGLAAAIPPGSQGVTFLPYLAGERSPIWDEDASGVFFGLTYQTTKAHFFRAMLEGVAFSLRHNIETAQHAGVSVGVMHAMGGAANSDVWTQMKADVTGKTIRVPDADAATVRGAAILAGVGAGVYKSCEAAADATVKYKREYHPDIAAQAAYEKAYDIYRELYTRLAPLMHKANGEANA